MALASRSVALASRSVAVASGQMAMTSGARAGRMRRSADRICRQASGMRGSGDDAIVEDGRVHADERHVLPQEDDVVAGGSGLGG